MGARGSVYVAAGGDEAFLALAQAHHDRCLEDPYLAHPFSHEGLDPEHLAHLAAYWAEVMGGPTTYSVELRGQSALVRMHLGNGDLGDLRERFVSCFDAAYDDAGLPDDPELRRVLHDYMVWAVDDVVPRHDDPDAVPEGLGVPRWGWDGLEG